MFKTAIVMVQVVALGYGAYANPLRIEVTPKIVEEKVVEDVTASKQYYCLAQNIYFEARNQDMTSMAAIGHVTMNRVADDGFPDTVCKVIKQGPMDGSKITRNRCQFSWYCDGIADVPAASGNVIEVSAWEQAQLIAELIMRGDLKDTTDGSTYYHADYVNPFWTASFKHVATIGDHLFYAH